VTSHREAPSISKDPVADNTDVYAFVSPDKSSTATLIANFIPFEEPAGGPNFHQFGDDVLYEILVDNNGDGIQDITFQFRFKTVTAPGGGFLYNVGPISSLTDPNWKIRQFYSLTKIVGFGKMAKATVLGTNIPCPPARVGPRSTPNYEALASAAITSLDGGIQVFAGPRGEGFYVDLGSIFDLGTLRPFENLHLIPTPAAPGVNTAKGFNVHSLAIQLPKTMLTSDGSNPTDIMSSNSVIGVWARALRQKVSIVPAGPPPNDFVQVGPFVQVSRLGMPLINEVVIPVQEKDEWNIKSPTNDSQFLQYYADPQLQNLLPILYPGVFPKLAALLTQPAATRPRSDLVAILLTGIPSGLIPGFQNFTGPKQADELRLNLAIAPTTTDNNPADSSTSRFGLLGGDLGGFPNGRRVFDNVTAIELRAIAGVTYPLVAPTYTPDGAAGLLTDGTTNPLPYLNTFPYLSTPWEGYSRKHD
jgi:hypothetical protein